MPEAKLFLVKLHNVLMYPVLVEQYFPHHFSKRRSFTIFYDPSCTSLMEQKYEAVRAKILRRILVASKVRIREFIIVILVRGAHSFAHVQKTNLDFFQRLHS